MMTSYEFLKYFFKIIFFKLMYFLIFFCLLELNLKQKKNDKIKIK